MPNWPRLARGALAVVVSTALGSQAAPSLAEGAPGRLQVTCRLDVAPEGKVGAAVRLRMRLDNASGKALHVLTWNTPFEGDWFGAFVEVSRDGQTLAYQGPMLKRGEPLANEYLALGARRSRQASLDLAQAFDLTRPGRYRVVQVGRLADVAQGAMRLPRPRESFQEHALDCQPVEFTLR